MFYMVPHEKNTNVENHGFHKEWDMQQNKLDESWDNGQLKENGDRTN